MSRSHRDRARFERKELNRNWRNFFNQFKTGNISQAEYEERTSCRATERQEVEELRLKGGMASHKHDHDYVPRTKIFRFRKAFRKMLYRGEYKGDETDHTTETPDEG